MFGLFKKKKTPKDAQFELALVQFTTDFAPVMRAIDPQNVDEMIRRATTNYYEQTPDEAGNSASDFYFDAFTGAIFELTGNTLISPQDSLSIFSMVDHFLSGHGQYQTPFVLGLMDSWQNMLTTLGAIEVSPTGAVG
jgi:hypothetical protein